jgi:hypothetical protein
MTKDEALKLALEALKKFHYAMIDADVLDRQEVLNEGFTAATAIKEALALPQRTWVGLTNDELTDLFYNTNLGQQSAVAQAIALLKERNT